MLPDVVIIIGVKHLQFVPSLHCNDVFGVKVHSLFQQCIQVMGEKLVVNSVPDKTKIANECCLRVLHSCCTENLGCSVPINLWVHYTQKSQVWI